MDNRRFGVVFLLLLCMACRPSSRSQETETATSESKGDAMAPEDFIRRRSVLFEHDMDVERFVQDMPERQLVLLGESTHGTRQYYRFRAAVSRRLIEERGVAFIAVEGDWASLYRLNQYVKGQLNDATTARDVLKTFSRWPTWMWANEDVLNLVEWLKTYNASRSPDARVGFYGMDVYGQWEAADDLLDLLERHMPEVYARALSKISCFATDDRDEWRYAREVLAGGPSCEKQMEDLVSLVRDNLDNAVGMDASLRLSLLQAAKVFRNAERFYRFAVQGGASAWNSRVRHMNDTVNRLMAHYGETTTARGIVWAHNTHVGDSRYAITMRERGRINIGRLSRQRHGENNVFIVGFSCFEGEVLAGSAWAAPMQKMRMPQASQGSVAQLFRSVGEGNRYLMMDDVVRSNSMLLDPRGHRAVGVVYHPHRDAANYVPTVLPRRYDALVYFEGTDPLVVVR